MVTMRIKEILRGVTHVNGSDNKYGLCIKLPISCMPHAHILLAPTTLSYYNDYHRPSTYAYSFNQVSQRGTSMPPVQRS